MDALTLPRRPSEVAVDRSDRRTADPEPAASPALLRRFRDVRARSVVLAAPLTAEDQVVQSMPDASPTKWHLAHTSWFFETMILVETEDYRAFDPAFSYLFNSYYEALGPRQPRNLRGLITRPSLDAVMAYRAHVDRAMERRLGDGSLGRGLLGRAALGLAHEEQHQELLLTDALHLLAQNPTQPTYDSGWPKPAAAGAGGGLVAFPGGLVEIGAEPADGLSAPFVFDNEGPRHRTYLQPFGLADRLVTNAEWLRFIQEGGYRRPELWLSDGWAAVRAGEWDAPLYWRERTPGDWTEFGPRGPEALDADSPVQHISGYEADAFARWAGSRLPTEAEWEHACRLRPDDLRDLFGAVWQWTASAYAPYPGFRPGEGALGEYNGKFMINQLVLRGSSWATSPGHSRPSYRNFFQPHQRWQATGVRLASDAV